MRCMCKTRDLRLAFQTSLTMTLLLATALVAQTAQWRSFGSPTDGFRALFPAEPEVSRTNVPVGNGSVELRSYVAEAGSTALYIGVCDYGTNGAARNPEELLTNAKYGAVDHANAHILSEKKIGIGTGNGDPRPGVEFEAESDKLHFTVRMFVVDGVLYQTMVATPLNEKFTDTVRFLDSFEPLPQARAVAAAPSPTPDWQTYRYPLEGFSADFPFLPSMAKQSISTDAGEIELRTYVAEDSSTALIAAVCDYGASAAGKDPETLLEGAKKGAINNLKAQLASEKTIELGSHHGIEFEADSDSVHVSARIYLAGAMLYQTIVASPLHARYAGTARFLDSFQVLGSSGK
jgi:hypothetical protein